jgi:hypothetical protein
LQAKLLLRAGKLYQAASLLAKASQSFPMDEPGTNAPTRLEENLFVRGRLDYHADTPAGDEVLAEIGVLKLARNEFAQALDALLNAGFWFDAAYVAERVLTTDELKTYVDRTWPVVKEAQSEREPVEGLEARREEIRGNIRYLLGRRLTREKRGHEAWEYYPVKWQPAFDQLVRALNASQDETIEPRERGRQMFAAAIMARTNGLELIGTEVEPDWHVFAGDYEGSVTIQVRTNESFGLVRASDEETTRAFSHVPDPNVRFHYRHQAAYLGWAAAKLLPDNSEETALVLCRSGSWLKNTDLGTADLFYKSLVRRCRKTELGAEADRIRWFPQLDENGNWIPREHKLTPAGDRPSVPADALVTPAESTEQREMSEP